jgi:integrase/recombinase XerD
MSARLDGVTANLPARIVDESDRPGRLAEAFRASADNPHTRSARRADIEQRWLPWCTAAGLDPLGTVRAAHLLAWLAQLADAADAEPTRARRLSNVSAWYRWLLREEVVIRNPVELLDPRTEKPRKSQRINQVSPTGCPSTAQVQSLQRTADDDGPLSSVLVALLATTGARVSELVGADVEDITQDRGHVVLIGRGKGGKTRPLPLPPATWHRVQVWLESRTPDADRLPAVTVGARPRRPLLARSTGRRLTRQEVDRTLRRLAVRAGLDGLHLSAHSLRHAYATDLLADGTPLYDVQRAMGHASADTTAYYDHGALDPDRHPTYRRAAQLAGSR